MYNHWKKVPNDQRTTKKQNIHVGTLYTKDVLCSIAKGPLQWIFYLLFLHLITGTLFYVCVINMYFCLFFHIFVSECCLFDNYSQAVNSYYIICVACSTFTWGQCHHELLIFSHLCRCWPYATVVLIFNQSVATRNTSDHIIALRQVTLTEINSAAASVIPWDLLESFTVGPDNENKMASDVMQFGLYLESLICSDDSVTSQNA